MQPAFNTTMPTETIPSNANLPETSAARLLSLGIEAYGQSKFANLLCAKELSRQFTGTNKTANAVHPGVIQTNLGRSMNPLFSLGWSVANPIAMKNVHEGAATQTFVATHPLAADISGAYFADCNVTSCRSDANDAELARRLWDVSREIVNGL